MREEHHPECRRAHESGHRLTRRCLERLATVLVLHSLVSCPKPHFEADERGRTARLGNQQGCLEPVTRARFNLSGRSCGCFCPEICRRAALCGPLFFGGAFSPYSRPSRIPSPEALLVHHRARLSSIGRCVALSARRALVVQGLR